MQGKPLCACQTPRFMRRALPEAPERWAGSVGDGERSKVAARRKEKKGGGRPALLSLFGKTGEKKKKKNRERLEGVRLLLREECRT